MTSSLSSIFDFGQRRAVCLVADRLFVYHWERRRLSKALVFDASEVGIAAFARYLDGTERMLTWFLVDIIEEEFQLDHVPHVLGSDRRSLFTRKLDRYFRNTPYRYGEVLQRETSGRKDDLVLFSALTRPELLKPWLSVLEKAQVPVTGIYSRSYLTTRLLKSFNLPSDNTVVISLHNPGGLRQSFIHAGKLRFSRLARLPRRGTVPYAPLIVQEIEKLQQYLHAQRLLAKDDQLRAVIIADQSLLEDLKEQPASSEQVRYILADTHTLVEQAGVENASESLYADALFAHILLKNQPADIYGREVGKRFYSLERVRKGLVAASVVVFVAAALWSSFTLVKGVSYKQDRESAQRKADFYQARFQLAKEGLPETPVEPYQIENAVEAVEELQYRSSNPAPMLAAVSRVLEGFANLQIDAMDWHVSASPEADADSDQTRIEDPDERHLYYQIARIDGHVDQFDGNYRQVLDSINFFAEALRAQPDVVRVTIENLPLDVSSEASLTGSATGRRTAGQEATGFSISIIMGVADGREKS